MAGVCEHSLPASCRKSCLTSTFYRPARHPAALRPTPSRRPALHHHRLGFEPDAEALVDTGLYGFGQRHDLAAGHAVTVAAPVHQHQGLLFIHARLADRFALPAADLDQPAGGQLEAAVEHGVMHNPGVARDDVGALVGRHRGVFEEAADVAEHRRVRQLGAADVADPVEDLSGIGVRDTGLDAATLQV